MTRAALLSGLAAACVVGCDTDGIVRAQSSGPYVESELRKVLTSLSSGGGT